MSESDGIGEAVEGEVRAAVMAAAQIAEQVAQRAERRARELERAARTTAAQFEQRLAAERETARAEVAVTRNPRWWDTAKLDQAARASAVAEANQIGARIADRFGPAARDAVVEATRTGQNRPVAAVDLNTVAQVRDSTAEATYARIVAEDTRRQAAAVTAERAAAATTAGTAAAAAQPGTGPGWDTSDRREAFAASLQHVPDPEGVDARIRLDRSRATPGRAAAAAAPSVRARPGRAPVIALQNEVSR